MGLDTREFKRLSKEVGSTSKLLRIHPLPLLHLLPRAVCSVTSTIYGKESRTSTCFGSVVAWIPKGLLAPSLPLLVRGPEGVI